MCPNGPSFGMGLHFFQDPNPEDQDGDGPTSEESGPPIPLTELKGDPVPVEPEPQTMLDWPVLTAEARLERARSALEQLQVDAGMMPEREVTAHSLEQAKAVAAKYLPAVLSQFPEAGTFSSTIAEQLVFIALATGSAADAVMRDGLSEGLLTGAFGTPSWQSVGEFQWLCRELQDETTNFIEAAKRLKGSFPDETPARIILEATRIAFVKVLHAKVSFLDFFGGALTVLRPEEGAHNWCDVFPLIAKTWNGWGPIAAERIGGDFLKLIPYLESIKTQDLKVILKSCDEIGPECASVVLSAGTAIAAKGGSEVGVRFFERVVLWRDRLGTPYAGAVSEYFFELKKIELDEIGERVLSAMFDHFGTFPVGPKKIAQYLGVFRLSLASATQGDLDQLTEDLGAIPDLVLSIRRTPSRHSLPKAGLAMTMVACVVEGSDRVHSYINGPEELLQRFQRFTASNYFRPSHLQIPDGLEFTLQMAAEGSVVRVKKAASLATSEIKNLRKRFLPEYSHWEDHVKAVNRSVKILAGLAGDPRPHSGNKWNLHEILPLLMKIARDGSDSQFQDALGTSYPHLFHITGLSARPLAFVEKRSVVETNSPTLVYDFLTTARSLIEDRLVPYFWEYDVPRERINFFKYQCAKLDLIEQELEKFTQEGVTTKGHKVRVRGGLHAYDRAMLDQRTESCLLRTAKTDPLAEERLDTLTLFLDETDDCIGHWNILTHEIYGQPTIVLSGDGPRSSIARAVHGGELRRGIVEVCTAIGAYNNQALGGICQGVGPPVPSRGWLFDHQDRVLTWSDKVPEFIPKNPVVTPLQKVINWPPEYKDGITHVIWLSGGPLGRR